jgi:hypothetical protein
MAVAVPLTAAVDTAAASQEVVAMWVAASREADSTVAEVAAFMVAVVTAKFC